MRVISRSDSRNVSGALMISIWISCNAIRRAATAVLRHTLSTRNDSTNPSRVFGVTVRIPANAAWAAFSASMVRSEEHTSELQSLMRTSYAVFGLKKKKNSNDKQDNKLCNLLL